VRGETRLRYSYSIFLQSAIVMTIFLFVPLIILDWISASNDELHSSELALLVLIAPAYWIIWLVTFSVALVIAMGLRRNWTWKIARLRRNRLLWIWQILWICPLVWGQFFSDPTTWLLLVPGITTMLYWSLLDFLNRRKLHSSQV